MSVIYSFLFTGAGVQVVLILLSKLTVCLVKITANGLVISAQAEVSVPSN